jgi:hypothetical protein
MPTAHETSEGTAATKNVDTKSLVKPTAECKGAAAEATHKQQQQ